jgi:hypothetical protein
MLLLNKSKFLLMFLTLTFIYKDRGNIFEPVIPTYISKVCPFDRIIYMTVL